MRTVALLGVLVLLSLVFAVRGFGIDPPFPYWDEGTHLTDALEAYRALTTLGPKELLLWLDAPHYYPWLHPLLTALAWLAGGLSLEIARGLSIAATILLAPVLWLLARQLLPPEDADLAALLATSLTFGSTALRLLEGRVMLDPLGTLVTTLALLAYGHWRRRLGWGPAAVTAAFVLAAFFTKYNYGVILGVALAVHALLSRAGFRAWLQASVLFGLPALLWLYQEPAKKLTILLEYLGNRRFDLPLARRLAFPALTYVRDHTVWLPVGVLALGILVLAWRQLGVRSPAGVLLLLPLLQALAQMSSTNQQPRFILPAVPAAHLAAAAVVARWARVRHHRRLGVEAAATVLALPLLLPPGRVLGVEPSWAERQSLRSLHAWVTKRFAGRPIVLVGGFFEYPPALGPFEGVRLASRRSGRVELDAPPLFLPCPPAYLVSSRAVNLPLADADTARILDRSLADYQAGFGSPVPLLVLTLGARSPFRYWDYADQNAWQEGVAAAVRELPARSLESWRTPAAGLEARLHLVEPGR